MADVRDSCKAFVPQLCYAIENAVDRNAESLGDMRSAGVSHSATLEAAADVRAATTVLATSETASLASGSSTRCYSSGAHRTPHEKAGARLWQLMGDIP